MDIQRPDVARRKWIRRLVFIGVLAVTIPALTIGIDRLKPAAPLVEAASVWPGQVKRGPMTRMVRGLGTLVAEETLWVPAVTDGRVERVFIWPGTTVEPDSVILTLTNPELELATLEADFQVRGAEARLKDLRVQLQSQTLTQQAEMARVESDHIQARLIWERDESLYREGLIVELKLKISRATAQELDKRLNIERERL
ncbi:MAG: efflux RND transporter periplasmic adaptor subunit, partial [Acidobacteriia bacterium]|nr:efflux RND transporter periplasmic adaptor subunit [Terriglobia bacterium]